MGLSDQLKSGTGNRWQKVVIHPFVTELGDDTLPWDKFQVYFDQDYLFLKDWSILLSLATAKAPDFDAARHIVEFLSLGLGGEEGLFQEAFRQRGMSVQEVTGLEYRPTTLAYSGFLRNLAYSGEFIDVVATLLAVEWPYLDWALRLAGAGKRPSNHYYQTWIDLHASAGMSDFVAWMRHILDQASISPNHQKRLQQIFIDVLRYEFLFWEMAYRNEEWTV